VGECTDMQEMIEIGRNGNSLRWLVRGGGAVRSSGAAAASLCSCLSTAVHCTQLCARRCAAEHVVRVACGGATLRLLL
jgi:hypothetical protein